MAETVALEAAPLFQALEALREFDHALFSWINGTAGPPVLDQAAVLAGNLPPLVAAVVLGLLWFWPGPKRHSRRVIAVLLVLAVLLALGFSEIPALMVYRERPFVSREVQLLGPAHESTAFPSRHSAGAGAFAAVLGGYSRRFGQGAWLLTWMSMFARVRMGVHFPFDVLGGALFGWAMGIVIRRNQDVLRAFAERVVATAEAIIPL